MAFTYDFSTQPLLSYVRLRVPDTDASHPIFTDDEVNAALTNTSSQAIYMSAQAVPLANSVNTTPLVFSPRMAAAVLVENIAGKLAQKAAVEQILDVKLSYDKAASEARAHAQALRDEEGQMGHFAIAEMVVDQFSARERVWNQLLRIEGN